MFEDVWTSKERALVKHYGSELWAADEDFPSVLRGVKVASMEDLLASSCRVVLSCVAPRLGCLEDKLTDAGFTVVSISPYKRQEGTLCVLEANHDRMKQALSTFFKEKIDTVQVKTGIIPQAPLIKSPNCVCCGTSTVLAGLVSGFGNLDEVAVTTFQSLSGRGDAMYPAELVVGNVYPLHGTSEQTEALITEELETVLAERMNSVSVTAYRVSVQRGHLVDVRVKLVDRTRAEAIKSPEDVYKVLEEFRPMSAVQAHLPSVPAQPIVCERAGGCPRPKTHHLAEGGLQVTVGNVKVRDGQFDICVTLVVDNLVKGALGAALQLLEYRNYLNPLSEPDSDETDESAASQQKRGLVRKSPPNGSDQNPKLKK